VEAVEAEVMFLLAGLRTIKGVEEAEVPEAHNRLLIL
jgi:hypothetical protein